MSALQRITFARDEQFLGRATLGGLLGTGAVVAFLGLLDARFSFDGALAGAAIGVLLGATRLPLWVRVFASVGAFVVSVILASRVPASAVAVVVLGLSLAVEPRQHWVTRIVTPFTVGAGTLWAWSVTRAFALPHLHAPWLGVLATLADGLFLALGAWAGSLRVSPDEVTLRLEAISGAAAAWDRVRRAKEKFPAFAPLTTLLSQGAERLITAGRALDELRIDEQLEKVTRDAVTALNERLSETSDEELKHHLQQTLRVHNDVLEQLDSLKRKKERAAAQVRAHVSWLETAAFSLETAPGGAQALDDVTQRLAKLAPA